MTPNRHDGIVLEGNPNLDSYRGEDFQDRAIAEGDRIRSEMSAFYIKLSDAIVHAFEQTEPIGPAPILVVSENKKGECNHDCIAVVREHDRSQYELAQDKASKEVVVNDWWFKNAISCRYDEICANHNWSGKNPVIQVYGA